jgi:hypothetical protein
MGPPGFGDVDQSSVQAIVQAIVQQQNQQRISSADIEQIAEAVRKTIRIGLVVDGRPAQVIGHGEAFVLEHKKGEKEVLR